MTRNRTYALLAVGVIAFWLGAFLFLGWALGAIR